MALDDPHKPIDLEEIAIDGERVLVVTAAAAAAAAGQRVRAHVEEHASGYPWSGRLSFSLLKTIAPPTGSPAHFLRACKLSRTSTAALRRGTLVHAALFGPQKSAGRPCVYNGDKVREPKEWRLFKALHGGEDIYTPKEIADAQLIADAVRSAPHNAHMWTKWCTGDVEYELPLEWEFCGIPFRTRGVDCIRHDGPEGRSLVDFKTTWKVTAQQLRYYARDMRWAEQIATYDEGLRQAYVHPTTGELGFEAERHGVLVVNIGAPYLCRVLEVSRNTLIEARKEVFGWLDTLRQCLDTDAWPGHVDDEIQLDPGSDLEGLGELEEFQP